MDAVTQDNKFGLSKKTNIGIAAMAALSAAQQHWQAIVAIAVVACLGIVVQGIIDYKKIERKSL